jgi:hypothetical protein
MTTVSSLVKYIVEPTMGSTMYVFTYTKVNVGDTFNVATGTAIKSILFAKAMIDADGADDPLASISGTTVTFTTGTGAGRLFVVGKG